MSNSTTNNPTGGIGFFGLLTIVFIALKLTGYIAWSWFWVLAPITIPLTIFAAFLIIAIFVAFAKGAK